MPPPSRKLEALSRVYTSEVIAGISARAGSDNGLNLLSQMLAGVGEGLVVDRAHLNAYLQFAEQRGGLDADRLGRLRHPHDYAAWKAVHNELLVPYFFSKTFRLKIEFTVNPTRKGEGDFQIVRPEGRIIVEVKTPRGDDPNLQGPQARVHCGWDEDLLRPAFLQAAKQLQRGNRNLIVICAQLCAWIHDSMPFERLLYGQDVITAEFDPETGQTTRPRTVFEPSGELLRYKWKRRTRISAVASLRTDTYCGGPFNNLVRQVQFTVLHNCFALAHIPPNVFGGAEQFVPDENRGRIKHVNKHRSTMLLYLTDTPIADIHTRLTVFFERLLRALRRVWLRAKIRRVAKAMQSERNDTEI